MESIAAFLKTACFMTRGPAFRRGLVALWVNQCSLRSPRTHAFSARSRYRKVTIWAQLQVASGEKVVSVVPPVIAFSTAHSTALV